MSSEPTEAQPLDTTIRFRPSKKRKVYRSRVDDEADDDDHAESKPHPQPASASASESRAVASDFFGEREADDTAPTPQPPSVALAALRNRTARRSRLQGVGFGTHSQSHAAAAAAAAASDERGLVLRQPQPGDDGAVAPAPVAMAKRFTQQTGLVANVDDKHMNQYIESRLSSRASAAPDTQQGQEEQEQQRQEHHNQDDPSDTRQRAPGQPVMQGKLMEVDLTSHPVRAGAAHDRPDRERKRERLGPDGKPWRSRKRRGSDDVKRDRLVEEFLSENALGVYDVPANAAPSPEVDGEADERLAEEFRRQFLDDVARRRNQQQQRKKKKPAQAASEDVLKGPKLGGSRNQRAAVRDILLKKEKEAKK